jgi:osmotically-inducible protein OsmY
MSPCRTGIEAAARDGNLTLTGRVRYGAQRGAAEQAVAGLTGVRNIEDETELWIDADPADVILLVQDALDRSALVADDSDVAVDAGEHAGSRGRRRVNDRRGDRPGCPRPR